MRALIYSTILAILIWDLTGIHWAAAIIVTVVIGYAYGFFGELYNQWAGNRAAMAKAQELWREAETEEGKFAVHVAASRMGLDLFEVKGIKSDRNQ